MGVRGCGPGEPDQQSWKSLRDKILGGCAIGDYEIKYGHAVLDELFSFVLFSFRGA
jgi:hypothetical protein